MKDDFGFKINLLKYFWDNRDRKLIEKPTGVMKQKYLFFYNVFAKINNQDYTLNELKAFKNGPVYADVYKASQSGQLLEKVEVDSENIDPEIAETTLTLLYLYKDNISTITHTFDLWKNNGHKGNITDESITDRDIALLQTLYNETKDVHDNYSIIYNKAGVPLLFRKEEKNKIINNYYDEIQAFCVDNKCPTYVTLNNGEVCFD